MKIVRPHILAIFSAVILLLFTLIKPSSYSHYLGEYDVMYLDWSFYGFLLTCVIAFILGNFAGYTILSRRMFSEFKPKQSLVVSIAYLNIALLFIKIYFVQSAIGIGKILSSYQGSSAGYSLKNDLNDAISGGKIGWITDVNLLLLIFLTWVFIVNGKEIRFKILYLINISAFLIISLSSLSRDAVTSVAIATIFIYFGEIKGDYFKKMRQYIVSVLVVAALITSIFFVVDQARNGTGKTDQLVSQLYGYFPASVNRAAAIYNNRLKYPNSGSGYYSTQFIWDFPLLSSAFNFPEIARSAGLNIPRSPEENWKAQFSAVFSYNFNERYIWATVFGFAYADFKNWAWIYFLLYGFLAGIFYVMYVKKTIFGVLLYSFSIITIVKWGSVISFSQRIILISFVVCTVIFLANRIVLVKRRKQNEVHTSVF